MSTPRDARWFAWLALAAIVIGLDQLTKAIVLNNMAFGESIFVTSFFNLKFVTNPGAAWSFLANAGGWQRWFFIVLGIAVSLWLAVMIRRHQQERLQPAAFALILGGAIGNVIDRFWLGEVIDFLDFHLAGWHFPAFNLADSAITLGVILMFVHILLFERKANG